MLPFAQPDFGSILKFIETNWNLGPLGQVDAIADNRGDMFNYKQTPFHLSERRRCKVNAAQTEKDRTHPDNE